MAYVCFKCLQSFRTIKLLWYHLRTLHNITTKSTTRIICAQEGCNQVYYSGFGYKRHLNRDHSNDAPQNELHVAIDNEMLEDENEFNENMSDEDENQELANEIQPRSKAQILEDAQDATVKYVACLKGSKIPTSTVQIFLNEGRNLVDNIVSGIEEIANPILEDVSLNRVSSEDKVQNLRTVMSNLKDPFETFRLTTDYKQKQFLRKAEVLVEPRQITLGKVPKEHLNKSGRTEQKDVEETFQYVPLRENLKLFLQQPGYMSSICANQELNDHGSVLQTYRSGQYFKSQANLDDDGMIVIDLLIYTDDFETANPLGSKKGVYKLLGVYMSLICLPLKYQSKLDNILLVSLVESSLASKYGINTILSPITSDLQELNRTGMYISCPEFTGLVRPRLFQVIGDNLALNSVLGFAGSFSATYFCRACKTSKTDSQTQVLEDERSMRTPADIDEDIEKNDLRQTGLNRSCEFNKLNYYHVGKNFSFDIMHDFYEGLLPIEMKLVLSELLSQDLFTLEEFNSRIRAYSYGFANSSNRPSPIFQTQLNKPFGASGQSASEMACLAINFPIIIGDKVESDNDFWQLYMTLLEIYKIVVAPSITIEGTFYLKALIQHHHQLYLELFPEYHLIPKHHNLLHYPRAIRQLGPLCQYTSMRPEGKHKPLKSWAKSCHNYKNIARTLATKHQEAQALNMLKEENIERKSIDILQQNVIRLSELTNGEHISTLLGKQCDTEVVLCESVVISGYKFRSNSMVLIDWVEELPKFGCVELILLHEGNILLIVQPWITLDLNEHYHAYASKEDTTKSVVTVQPSSLADYRPVHVVQSYSRTDHTLYIPTRYVLV